MKIPKLNKVVIDKKGTERIRAMAKKSKKVKITINIDYDSLADLKAIALKNGGSYQKLLNQLVKDGLESQQRAESRLDRLEKEIEKIRKKLAS